jgi:hypothetical protein
MNKKDLHPHNKYLITLNQTYGHKWNHFIENKATK